MMEINGTNLDTVFILAGIAVWAWVIVTYVRPRSEEPVLSIPRRPDPSAIDFGPEMILLVLLMFLIGGFLTQQTLTLVWPSKAPGPLDTLSRQFVADSVVKILTLAAMITWCARSLAPARLFNETPKPCRLSEGIKRIFLALMIFFALYPLVNVLLFEAGVVLVENILHLPTRQTHQAFELLNDPHTSPAVRVVCLLLAGVISPVAEEFFFRGILQNLFYKRLQRPIIAIILAGFCFMLVHAPQYQNFPALWMLGIILGWSYYRYRTLAVPVLTHMIFNSASLILWWRS